MARGATNLNIYDRFRLKSLAPSRLEIDGRSISDWRAKGFFDVLGGAEPNETLLMQLLGLMARHPTLQPKKPVEESNFCPADADQGQLLARSTPAIGMPYGLPPLSQSEIETLSEWTARGTPGPSDATLVSQRAVPPELQSQVRTWEAFLNGETPRDKLVARYLYEHLFLAHVHFPSEQAAQAPPFFRLVRSQTRCDAGVDEIATRRPMTIRHHRILLLLEAPQRHDRQYILTYRTISLLQKLERMRRTFFDPQWEVRHLPDYSEAKSGNPFAVFADIPVHARYQFLLDDAEYEIATFINGTRLQRQCRGQLNPGAVFRASPRETVGSFGPLGCECCAADFEVNAPPFLRRYHPAADICIFCCGGEHVGNALALSTCSEPECLSALVVAIEEAIELSAGQVEGALVIFGSAAGDERSALVIEGRAHDLVRGLLSQPRGLMQVQDELAAEEPQVVAMLT